MRFPLNESANRKKNRSAVRHFFLQLKSLIGKVCHNSQSYLFYNRHKHGNLNLKDLKKNGLSAALLCFLPATAEIGGYLLLGTLLLELPVLDAAILGCVMAAVSPAVVVPRMLRLKETGYGTDKEIPDMIMTGASADDVFVIVLFTSLTGMATGGTFSWNIAWQIPVSILLGVGVGIGIGFLFLLFVKKFHMRDSIKVILMLSIAFLFVALENAVSVWVPYSGLLSVISFGAVMFAKHTVCAERLSKKFSKLWIFAEILLFVLVGAEVNIAYALENCGIIIGVILLALLFRMLGVFLCVAFSKLNAKERLFCMIAYMPKATVQAAIGALPLAMGLASGQTILTAAVLAILITAPLGAFLTDLTYRKLLSCGKGQCEGMHVDGRETALKEKHGENDGTDTAQEEHSS